MRLLACCAALLASCAGSATPPLVAQIWGNGELGKFSGWPVEAWGSGAAHFQVVDVTDTITGGRPSMQITDQDWYLQPHSGTGDDAAPYKSGHLQFDIRLETSAITGAAVALQTPLSATLPPLSTTTFTHVSIKLTDLFGTDGPASMGKMFQISFQSAAAFSPGQALATVNDVKWTSD